MEWPIAPDLVQRIAERVRATERDPADVLDEVLRAGFDALEEEAAIALGDAELERGEGIPHEDVMRELARVLEQLGPRDDVS